MEENQYFGRQTISMSRPPLDSTPFGKNKTNRTTSPIYSVPVRKKNPYHTPQTQPTYFPTQPIYSSEPKGKAQVPADPDPDPSLSDSSSNKYNFLNDNNSSKSNKNKRDKKKNRRKHKKRDSSDSSLSDSDSSDDSDERHKQQKKKSHRKKDPIKLCSRLTEKLLATAYKSKTIMFKLDEDPLQRRIYFFTLVESLKTIFSQYKETCEVLLDDSKIGGENIKEFSKDSIVNILHANIDVHIRRLISEFPRDGIKCIKNCNKIVSI